MSQGIDYSLGQGANQDPDNGIRYGVISTHSLSPYFWEDVEHDYGPPTCPKCGNSVTDFTDPSVPDFSEEDSDDYPRPRRYSAGNRTYVCDDFWCSVCEHSLDADEVYPDQPRGWSLVEGTNADPCTCKVIDCLGSDARVVKSLYYTFARFCSPCVPGACSLDSPLDFLDAMEAAEIVRRAPSFPSRHTAVRCYCLDKSWFDSDHPCPYPYWSVETNELIYVPPGLSIEDWAYGMLETTGEIRIPVQGDYYLNSLTNEATEAMCDSGYTLPFPILRRVPEETREPRPEEERGTAESVVIEEPPADVIDEVTKAFRGEDGTPLGVSGEEFLHDDYETQKRNEED